MIIPQIFKIYKKYLLTFDLNFFSLLFSPFGDLSFFSIYQKYIFYVCPKTHFYLPIYIFLYIFNSQLIDTKSGKVGRKPAKAHGYGVCSLPIFISKVGRKWANGQIFIQNHRFLHQNISLKLIISKYKWVFARLYFKTWVRLYPFINHVQNLVIRYNRQCSFTLTVFTFKNT